GLGEGEGRERLAGGEIREEPCVLLLRAAEEQWQRRQRLDAQDQAGRDAGVGDLLDREALRQEVRPKAAVLDRVWQREHILAGQQLPDVLGKLARAVDLGRARRDLLERELANRVPQEHLLLGQSIAGHELPRIAADRSR